MAAGSTDMEGFRRTFFDECADLLTQGEQHLTELINEPGDRERMAALFRAVHSIKGGAGAFGFERLVGFAHRFETVLDGLRSGDRQLDRAGHGLLLRTFDQLADLVRAARDGGVLGGDEEPQIAALEAWHRGADAGMRASGRRRWRVAFQPAPDLFRTGNEPRLLIRELKTLGDVTVTTDPAQLPALEDMDPETAYLPFVIEIETEATADRLSEVFDFVADGCRLEIGVLTQQAGTPASPSNPSGQAARAEGPTAAAGTAGSIRVDLDKLDRLVNMVGEIVITQAMLTQQLSGLRIGHGALAEGLEQMAHHTRELQESVMSIRAQAVGSVFRRMPRLVRDLAAELGKEVRVVMLGEATEVDKTVIEQLADPLTHMVRNAVDHGIERPEERRAEGKPEAGTITLSAEHRGGRILIEITDDGRGIDRERVRLRCVERGLIASDATPSDEEIDNFIFLPGFSTAERVSNISGRGVGMDVVKRNIQALGGRVHIISWPGKGSRFTLSLPLTLAVLDGMIVTVGGERYIVPLTNIVESLRPRAGEVSRLGGGGEVIAIRGDYVPLVRLADRFGASGAITDPTRGLVVLVEVDGADRIGLLVDELLGQQQVVIKSLESNYRRIEGVSAATILGDGSVALILDIAGLRAADRRLAPALSLAS